MYTPSTMPTPRSTWLKTALILGTLTLAGAAAPEGAEAASGLCGMGTTCERELLRNEREKRLARFEAALQRIDAVENARHPTELSGKDIVTFSGIGVVVCPAADGRLHSSTAFLVGAFDIAVTVAQTFESVEPAECSYNSIDSMGQVRERIPVSYVRSQWDTGVEHEPSTNLAVVRLSHPSRYAQRTMPFGRFSGEAAPVIMVGYRADLGAASVKRKARGTAFERYTDGVATASVESLAKDFKKPAPGFTHDMDSRGLAAGAPVIDERSGVIIGIHARLPGSHNTVITMNDWLEHTLRAEMKAQEPAQPEATATARAPSADNQ